jgi:Ala-tRNA(Pro) deacylase
MPATALKQFLDRRKVKYVSIVHSVAYTAQEVAESAHLAGKELAKTVIIKINGVLAMAVLPANRKVVLQDLREELGVAQVQFATEDEFRNRFPDCETGAMPPFGNLYEMEVYVSPNLAERTEIAFNACTHSELIQMSFADFERLANPKSLQFST